MTTAVLAWLCQRLASERQRVLGLLWDDAAGSISREVRTSIRAHHAPVTPHGGIRFLIWRVPSKSPWRNPIAPKWVHGKRAIVAPTRLLTAMKISTRVGAYFGCDHAAHLAQLVA